MIRRLTMSVAAGALLAAMVTLGSPVSALNGPFWASGAQGLASSFFVATSGSDSNAGTFTAPFATLAKCQSAMESSSTKTCYVRAGTYSSFTTTTCPTQSWSAVLDLDSADSGETFSYYPPDGVDSAVLNGSSTIKAGICINSQNGVTRNITINGLNLENFEYAGIFQQGGSNAVSGSILENNQICCTEYNVTSLGVGIYVEENSPSTTIKNNYIYKTGNMAINASAHSTPGGLDNLTIENNFTAEAPGCGDCGAIYMDDYGANNGTSGWSTGITINDNYVDNSNSGNYAIYLDDSTSNVTATGNVLIPGYNGSSVQGCILIHGGENNVFKYNICDDANGAAGAGWVVYQPVFLPNGCTEGVNCVIPPMTGNEYESNINICETSARCTQYGYEGEQEGSSPAKNPPNDLAIADNLYWNFGSGGVESGQLGSTPVGSDSNPTTANPQITCWKATIAGASPSFSSPVNLQAIPQSWGPLGAINPASLPGSPTTVTPSWGPGC